MVTRVGAILTPSRGIVKVTWSGLLNGDDGDGLDSYGFSDRSVQALGTFGVGGTMIMEGSNDGGTTWAPLTDPGVTAISFTAAGLKQVLQYTGKIRPRVTAGDGATNLTMVLQGRMVT